MDDQDAIKFRELLIEACLLQISNAVIALQETLNGYQLDVKDDEAKTEVCNKLMMKAAKLYPFLKQMRRILYQPISEN